MYNKYEIIFLDLYDWIKNQEYKGWDPYDGINNNFLTNNNHILDELKILLIQFNKYSLINFRKFLKIKKEKDIKGTSLILQSLNIYNNIFKKSLKTDHLIKYLLDSSLYSNYNYHCWSSHKYKYIGVDKSILTPNIPDIIGTSNVLKSLSFYKNRNKKEISSIYNYYLNNIGIFKNNYYYKYTPLNKNKIIINASAEALSSLSNSLKFVNNDRLLENNQEIVKTILKYQNKDGSWPYSIYQKKVYNQFDFHQGYIISGLLDYYNFVDSNKIRKKINHALKSGIKFYLKMLDNKGRFYYRYPKFYPIDIHNQSQGIITFTKLYNHYDKFIYKEKAIKIANWTINNMYDKNKYFYHQKFRFFTNKIPYIRWGESWMLLSLSYLFFLSGEK